MAKECLTTNDVQREIDKLTEMLGQIETVENSDIRPSIIIDYESTHAVFECQMLHVKAVANAFFTSKNTPI